MRGYAAGGLSPRVRLREECERLPATDRAMRAEDMNEAARFRLRAIEAEHLPHAKALFMRAAFARMRRVQADRERCSGPRLP